MATEAEPVAARTKTAQAAAGPKKKKKSAKRQKLARPLTEAEINVPDIQTLIMLGVLTVTSITMWAFAHAGCNYHPPRETRRPRDVTTAELVREPKDAGIEFQQRLLTLNYKGAAEIAAGAAADEVKKEQQSCAANAAECARRKTAAASAISAAVMLERGPTSAKLRVTTYSLPGGNRSFLTLVERDASGWKVTAHVPDGPNAKLPEPSLAPARPLFVPAPAGSSPGVHGLVLPPMHGAPAAPAVSGHP